jgi:hypothetical protein
MTWIVFPRSSVEVLINSKRLRAAASSHFSNVTSSGAAVVSAGDGNVASLVPFGDGSIVVAAWAASNTADMMIAGQPLLTIWSEPRQSTFLSIPDEELPNVLERICNLAIRLWEGVSVSELWNPNKVANHHSIFVSNRIMDLRLAYEMRKLDDISHLNVGTVYYAYRQEKSIQVPPLTESDVASILRTVARPDLVGDETFEDAKGSKRNEDDDPDVLINRGRGEDRHLFSMSRSDWMDKDSPLTRQQRRIIREKKFPLRIHGPVGSGKTLVLILKALELLRIGLENKEKCKVLIILHNNEVRNNVRAAIEAIDESGFLAATKNDSPILRRRDPPWMVHAGVKNRYWRPRLCAPFRPNCEQSKTR